MVGQGVQHNLGIYIRRHLRQYLLGALSVVLAVSLSLVSPRILAAVIDAVTAARITASDLVVYSLLMAGVAVLSAAWSLTQRRQMVVASRQIEVELRAELFQHLETLERAFYDRSRIGDLMSRLTADLNGVREMLGFGLNMGSRITLTTLGVLVAMFILEHRLALVVLLVVPLMMAVTIVLRRSIASRYKRSQERLAEIAALAQENFSGARVVRGYGIELRELERFDQLNARYAGENLALARIESLMPSLMGAFIGLASLGILLIGGRFVLEGTLSVGGYIAFTTYLAMLSFPISSAGQLVTIYQRGMTSWERLKELFEVSPQIRDPNANSGGKASLEPEFVIKGELEFRDVGLMLGGRLLLEEINLHIPAGSSLAITGRTGSGKTLLASLITRLVDPTEGAVFIDGRDVRTLPLAQLRSSVALSPQDPFLFSETLLDNIVFGLLPKTELQGAALQDRVRWATEVAVLRRDIDAFPLGDQTMLGERGITLSGGQRQRSALARAVMRDAKILVLDDSLSAVDTETEQQILKGVRSLFDGRTVVIIGHRVSALRQADQIVVLEAGRVVERGTHEELLRVGGYYADLERRQTAPELEVAGLEEKENEESIDVNALPLPDLRPSRIASRLNTSQPVAPETTAPETTALKATTSGKNGGEK